MTPSSRTGSIGVAMLGSGYMGRLHSAAYQRIAARGGPLRPRLVWIAGRTEERVAAAAQTYGFERHTTDWREALAAEHVELCDNGAPNNLHLAPTLAAVEAGKHVVCEKPLGRTAEESHEMWQRAAAAGVTHMCAFNYRFVPAVRRAREMIAAGEIGEIRHFRGRYLQEWLVEPDVAVDWRMRAETSGAGAIADLGSHVIDLARCLVGDPSRVTALTRTFTPERPGGSVNVDDAFASAVEFENGAIGTLEASRVARGRSDDLRWEVNGSRRSLAFELGRMNELQVADAPGAGFRSEVVPGPDGRRVEWADTFFYELDHLLEAIAQRRDVAPEGATFEDGYRAAVICDAVARSAATGSAERVNYRLRA